MIRVVWGTAAGETPVSSFDLALADAGVHQYNLRALSSVIPGGVPVEAVGTAPELGPTGNALNVAMARRTATGERAVAGLGWARDGDDGPGVFVELEGTDPDTVRKRLRAGTAESCRVRGIDDPDIETRVAAADRSNRHATAVVLAAYGQSEPLPVE